MAFFVEYDEGIKELGLPCEEIFSETAEEALKYTGCPYECEVNLTLTDDRGIREINRAYRDMDKPTDVLSFPFMEFEEQGDFSTAEEAYHDCFNPDTGELMLGDIMISVDRVRAQAEAYGHSVKREFAFLIAHSMLHLQGFDHETPDEAAVMEKAQNEILDKIGIRR
ncbi:MAG: rRNA maturation RNase YbeY [Lachnospiraceae bacterium]|nr:rRNA maturation RNase YbeY [Lachnospiraceae bacterium]